MRHGLMKWREDELSQADVLSRQYRLQKSMEADGIDGVLIYTNHVRSAAVTYLTGFTPYWSDALLFLPVAGKPLFATALSKRVGNWIKSTNPTSTIDHSPRPGELIGKHMIALGCKKVGVVELDHMPGGLIDEIIGVTDVQLVDASTMFAEARTVRDAAEIALAKKANQIATDAFASAPKERLLVGDVTEALELYVRNAGAEECYVAIAPDLQKDTRLARTKGQVELGETFAIRLSIAYNGVWIRRTESFLRTAGDDNLTQLARWADGLSETVDPSLAMASQLATSSRPAGASISGWTLEAPIGNRPLQAVATEKNQTEQSLPYGVLTIQLDTKQGSFVLARPIGLHLSPPTAEGAV
ncbi:MAG: hypothetical protein COB78_07245 [Hyphomicrobiales bacterium]|nr:MAG: hypothetical protein COB78_07245 [Hyphomicrobiales bacterium]